MVHPQFEKVLVANRGEIAVRAFRAAVELGIRTVAVFPWEDRWSEHRMKADESYQIGQVGHPIRAYLDAEAIVSTALDCGADAIYPGYGFLSENPELAQLCADSGITFIGPSASILDLAGNKSDAVSAARRAGVPTLASSDASRDPAELVRAGQQFTGPVFVKAVAGGGGRGLRLVHDVSGQELHDAITACMREAEAAFGDASTFIEQALLSPRHIEVQILADGADVVHLYERDCSLQRRNQKVIEIAPAPRLEAQVRDQLCRDAIAFAKSINYANAGTVEFLLDHDHQHYFIEMNPRVQVEHTVTEEITDVDIVQSQFQIAAGMSLASLGLRQDLITTRGAALQCRITTEDPANDFMPDTGKVTAYRSPGGAGVRLDGGTYTGAEVSGHFDSMLTKLTCRGSTFAMATQRARRALDEFRIRGVTTNISFLRAVVENDDFMAGRINTGFIAEHGGLQELRPSTDRATRLLTWLAETTVNLPHGPAPTRLDPVDKLPAVDLSADPPAGSRDDLQRLGPHAFAQALRADPDLRITDTTFRDAHQSLLATRIRTRDLTNIAPYISRLTPQLWSIEAWGGATYDVALRFLSEDPWERLAAIRQAVPNICLQMLLRGRNTVGYLPYPAEVTRAFVCEAARTGIDVFRIFDALNDVEQMRPAIDAVLDTGSTVAEVALCYTGDLSDPGERLYTLDYYLRLAEQIVDAGAHVLAIKDMAGMLRAPAATTLVSALRREFDVPVHLHTHDTVGGQLHTLLAAADAGVDAVDVASSPLAGTTSQPPMAALVAATDHSTRQTGLGLDSVSALEPYWEATRSLYAPFESGLRAATGRVYHHEIPGGQLSNLRQQARALGLGEKFEQIEDTYSAVNAILGRPVKVTPTSKVVGDLALHLVATDTDPADFAADPRRFDIPESVISFLAGDLGQPPGGWPEPLRSSILDGREKASPTIELDRTRLDALRQDPRTTLNDLLFPEPAATFHAARSRYGDLSVLDTADFLYGLNPGTEHVVSIEEGKQLIIELQSIGEPDERGYRTVMCILNGQLRPLFIRDHSITSVAASSEKADPRHDGHIASPFDGTVTVHISGGQDVADGDLIATIEAMKMESAIKAPFAGTIQRLVIDGTQQVEAGDLIAVVE